MKFALAGATGLIGGSVHARLSEHGAVTTIGRQSNSSVSLDLADTDGIDKLDLGGLDAFVHCAGVVDEDFRHDRETAFKRSITGMELLVRKAKSCGAKKFIYLSTSHVYGRLEGLINEHSAVNPLTDYALAHFNAEQMIRRHAGGGFRGVVFRPNAVFGMPVFRKNFDRWHLIPYSFPVEAVDAQKITLKTSGEQYRNFISNNDCARYIEKMIFSNEGQEEFTVINPLGTDTMSIYEFALMCADIYREITGKECRVLRPAVEETSKPSMDFRTIHSDYHSTENVRSYLYQFIHMLIKERGSS